MSESAKTCPSCGLVTAEQRTCPRCWRLLAELDLSEAGGRQVRVSGPVEPRGRRVLVFATSRAQAEARPILGDVVIENVVASLIVGGRLSRRPIPGVELRRGQRFVRPRDEGWVAVVRRGPGRLVEHRKRSCWWVVRVERIPAGEAS